MSRNPKSFPIRTLIFCAGAFLASPLCHAAAKLYRFTGEVTAVHKDSVTVRRGGEEAEFARPSGTGPVHVGDRITVLYGMDAKQFLASPQAPGQVPGNEDTPNQHIIMDDRAFYNAKNQSAAPAAPGNSQGQKNPG